MSRARKETGFSGMEAIYGPILNATCVRCVRSGDLNLYQNFLRIIAARSAQLLNLTDVARDLGIAVNTVKAWLSVLEATYQVIVLRPYFGNVGKRLVKTPKVYFTDTGTLCYLAGLKDARHAASGPMGGAIMETAVLSEIVKALVSRGRGSESLFLENDGGERSGFRGRDRRKARAGRGKAVRDAAPGDGQVHKRVPAGVRRNCRAGIRGAFGRREAPSWRRYGSPAFQGPVISRGEKPGRSPGFFPGAYGSADPGGGGSGEPRSGLRHRPANRQ